MAQTPSLLQKARERAPAFKRPDIGQFVPEEAKDAVARVVAAGQKLMFSPAMRDELDAEVQRDTPPAQKMAEAVTGLVLVLDKQSKGGIPVPAIFPAAMELLGEAADVLIAAGQPVDQAAYNEAAQRLFVLLGRKMGATDEQLMGAAEQAIGGGAPPEDEAETAEPPGRMGGGPAGEPAPEEEEMLS